MQTIESTREFVSIGQLAAHLQTPVHILERTAAELELAPAMRLNAIPYFDGVQVEKIAAHLKHRKETKP